MIKTFRGITSIRLIMKDGKVYKNTLPQVTSGAILGMRDSNRD